MDRGARQAAKSWTRLSVHTLPCTKRGCRNISQRPCFQLLRYISSSRIPGLYGNSTFNFLRNCHISISSCTVLHSHQHCTGSDFQYPCQHFFFLFFVVPILIAMEWYLLVVLISIFLMISGLNIFSCAYWPLLYLLQRNVY